jgi:drug/metabolite transporter (DMT)-like permease
MTGLAYALVVLSAAGHAWWNFLLKRSGGSNTFIALSKIVEALLLAPVLVLGTAPGPGEWTLPIVGAVLVLGNYALLTAAYRRSDLSLAYPIVRGSMLAFLPPLAFITIGERIQPIGALAIAAIVAGIAMLPLPSFSRASVLSTVGTLRGSSMVYPLLAGLLAACYTIWDKRAVQVLSPLTYFAAYTVLTGVVYAIVAARVGGALRRGTWRQHRSAIVGVAVLNSASYLLVLAALRPGKASYVIALRQLSIAGGALLGVWLLGEPLPPPRKLGIALVVAGCILVGLAR